MIYSIILHLYYTPKSSLLQFILSIFCEKLTSKRKGINDRIHIAQYQQAANAASANA